MSGPTWSRRRWQRSASARASPQRVELDRGVAELEALVGDVEVLLDGRERRRRGVRRDRVAVGPEQAVHRNPENASLEVPERDVDHAEEPDRELLGPVELPKPVPEPLAPVGPLADELVPKDAVDDVGEHRPAPLVVGLADGAVFGRDPEDGGRACLARSREDPAATRTAGRSRGGERDRRRLLRCALRMIIIRMTIRCQVCVARSLRSAQAESMCAAIRSPASSPSRATSASRIPR